MRGRPHVPLFWRIFIPNATVLAVAGVVLHLRPANGRILILGAGLIVMLAVNVVLMRRAFGPLARLTELMQRADPLRPGTRVLLEAPESEVTVMARAFNDMLARLERERVESGRRAMLEADAERRHVAAELHDEIGQGLTALLLQLDRAARNAPEGLRAELIDARDQARAMIGDVRALARRLRPEALALGLGPALTDLADHLARRTGLAIEHRVEEIAGLDDAAELVVYRVAQESLTNVVRHSGASHASLDLGAREGRVVLEVRDDGCGLNGTPEGGGLRMMRERALLVGGELTIAQRDRGGTLVHLEVPAA